MMGQQARTESVFSCFARPDSRDHLLRLRERSQPSPSRHTCAFMLKHVCSSLLFGICVGRPPPARNKKAELGLTPKLRAYPIWKLRLACWRLGRNPLLVVVVSENALTARRCRTLCC